MDADERTIVLEPKMNSTTGGMGVAVIEAFVQETFDTYVPGIHLEYTRLI